jgi:hypothetical protein
VCWRIWAKRPRQRSPRIELVLYCQVKVHGWTAQGQLHAVAKSRLMALSAELVPPAAAVVVTSA